MNAAALLARRRGAFLADGPPTLGERRADLDTHLARRVRAVGAGLTMCGIDQALAMAMRIMVLDSRSCRWRSFSSSAAHV